MNKLTLSDVKIKSPGKQLKELVIAEFGDINTFAEIIGMKKNTVIQYLKQKNLGSDTFRFRSSKALDKGLDEIIKSEEDQAKYMVQCIYDNIKEYKADEDVIVLKKVQELCSKNNLRLDNIKMQRNFAMVYFYRNEIDRATGFMESAIGAVKSQNYLIKWKSELGLMYFYQHKYVKSERCFREVEDLLSFAREIDNSTVWSHYYRYGVLKSATGRYLSAEKLFQKSFEHAKTGMQKKRTIMNIGITHKKRNRYKKAIEYYRKALDIKEDNTTTNKIFNNIAELYRLLKEYERALYYIKLSFDCIEEENIGDMCVAYGTYVQILIDKGDVGKAIEKLMELIKKADGAFVYKKFIVINIKTIAEYVLKTKNINILEDMEELIYQSINNASSHDEEYIKELKSYIELNIIYKKYMDYD